MLNKKTIKVKRNDRMNARTISNCKWRFVRVNERFICFSYISVCVLLKLPFKNTQEMLLIDAG